MFVALEDSRLARQLDGTARALLEQGATRQSYLRGEVVFEEGAVGNGLYVVEAGRVEIAARSVPGRLHRLAVMEPGDYFGEMSVFDGEPRSASAIAAEGVQACFIPTSTLLAMLERTPLLAAELVRESSRRMRDFNRRFLQEVLKAERLTLVERLARTIVHDFRNPLNVIGLSADLSAEGSATLESRRAGRDRIRRQVEVLNGMMQELLDFTRGMTPSALLPKVDYGQVLREIILELSPEAERRGVRMDVPREWPSVTVRADALRLHRVFNNLFQNALDALSQSQNPTLTLRVTTTEQEVITELNDNGPGIPAEVLGHVFQPFVTFGKAHGTGLGLAIADRILAEHGGKISVSNQASGGASFRFQLPRTKSGDTDVLPPKAS
jgi:signal transduction histidine kinase